MFLRKGLVVCFLFFVCLAGNLSGQTRTADSLALVNLYNATGGNNWTIVWNLNQPMDGWYGVTIDYSLPGGRVTCLDMDGSWALCSIFGFAPGNNLTGNLPDLNLTELRRILFRNNNLTGPIPDFSNMPKLVDLDIPDNQLSGSIPNFSNLPNLIDLNLGANNLSGNIPNFTNLPNLEILVLSLNQLTGTIPDFSALPSLEQLVIGSNQLTGSIVDLSSTPLLFNLGVSNNQLTGTIPDFSNLTKLEYLFLDRNQLTGVIPDFSFNPDLVSLRVDSNQLTGSIPDFTVSTDLLFIHAEHNQLTSTIPIFTNLCCLEQLHIDNNQLTFEDLIDSWPVHDTLTVYRYFPQDSIGIEETIYFPQGSIYSFDLFVDDTVTTNTYTWYRNGAFFTTTTVNQLTFPNFQASDQGVYRCEITNPILQNLTIHSREKTLLLDCPMTAVANQLSPVSCNGFSDGSASVTATGGILPYIYLWDNGSTTTSATGLNAGIHFVTITDFEGCPTVSSVTINEPTAITALLTSTNVSCNGGSD